jgi:hypothetical protein
MQAAVRVMNRARRQAVAGEICVESLEVERRQVRQLLATDARREADASDRLVPFLGLDLHGRFDARREPFVEVLPDGEPAGARHRSN